MYAQQPAVTVTQGVGPDDYDVDWEGVAGRFYTLQVSVDMHTWHYSPIIEYGTGAKAYSFNTTAPNGTFIRLRYQDIPLVDPLGSDIDNDGLTNQEEIFTHGTSPFEADTDGDGINDDYETGTGLLDPLDPSDAILDPDGDNLVNLWESRLGLSAPNVGVPNSDNDGDGLINNAEIYLSTAQNNSDTDTDGILDPDEDNDLDGLTNIEEFGMYGTDPLDADTENDQLPDGWEVQYGFDPLRSDPDGSQNATADPDGDGLTNRQEANHGTAPNNSDTDGDGVDDKTEVEQGSDPKDPNDGGSAPPDGTIEVKFTFGDPKSTSSSEKYKLVLTRTEGNKGPKEDSRINSKFGDTDDVSFTLPKGTRYDVKLLHHDTIRVDQSGNKDPEYDHIVTPDEDCWLVEKIPGLIGRGGTDEVEDDIFSADGKVAKLWVPLFRIQQVAFSGSPHGNLTDDTQQITYGQTHWIDNNDDGDADDPGDTRYPVAYVRDTSPTIVGSIKVTPASLTESDDFSPKIRVSSDSTLSIPLTVAAKGQGNIVLPPTMTNGKFLNQIDILDPLTFTWQVKINNQSSFCEAGDSDNKIYVTLEAPLPASSLSRQESLYDIGCRNAIGITDPNTAFNGIWSDFSGPIPGVKKVDGTNMQYWKNRQTTCNTFIDMVAAADGDGSCSAWALLMIVVIEVQGIPGTQLIEIESLYPNPPGNPFDNTNRSLMLVKNWTFNQGTLPPSLAPFTHSASQAQPAPGVEGQNNDDPLSRFLNHFIVSYDGKYYDPSYGTGPFANESEWENASLAGYSIRATLTDGNGNVIVDDLRKTNDPNTVEIKFIPK